MNVITNLEKIYEISKYFRENDHSIMNQILYMIKKGEEKYMMNLVIYLIFLYMNNTSKKK